MTALLISITLSNIFGKVPAILKRDSIVEFGRRTEFASRQFWNYDNFVTLQLFLFSCLIWRIVEIGRMNVRQWLFVLLSASLNCLTYYG